jgi:hypothetical protein
MKKPLLIPYCFCIVFGSMSIAAPTFAQQTTQMDSVKTESLYLARNVAYYDDSVSSNIESMSADFEVKDKVPQSFKLCISPLFPGLNCRFIQATISSQTEGIVKKIIKRDTIYNRGGLLSTFATLDTSLVKISLNGVKYNGVHDKLRYITVRNQIKWDKGLYRVQLYKSGYNPGKSLPADSIKYNKKYDINEYEHTWFTMTFENLHNHQKWTIGSVAVPGKVIKMDKNGRGMFLFLEIYQTAINYGAKNRTLPISTLYYKDIPNIRVTYKNFQINDKPVSFKRVSFMHSSDIIQEKLGRVVWNKEKGEIECEIGFKE